MNMNAVKRIAASVSDALGINRLGHLVQLAVLFPFIRVVNYHDIPREHEKNFEAQLKLFASEFVGVDESSLHEFLHGGVWPHAKPGLILSFDDGMRSHAEVAAPLLEKYGFKGWFFVPAGWVSGTDFTVGDRPDIPIHSERLTVAQLRQLAERHIVGCHTLTHRRLIAGIPSDELHTEIVVARQRLEELTGRAVTSFCWVGGEEQTYSQEPAQLIRQEYRFGFMTNNAALRPGGNAHQIQRTNIEAENPLSLVRFQISGLMDAAYYPKRKRVNRITL